MVLADDRPSDSWVRRYLAAGSGPAHVITIPRSDAFARLLFFSGPLAYAVAVPPVATTSIPTYLLLAVIGPIVLFYAPTLRVASRTKRYHLYRPNPYIDVYDDPKSRHWLVSEPQPAR